MDEHIRAWQNLPLSVGDPTMHVREDALYQGATSIVPAMGQGGVGRWEGARVVAAAGLEVVARCGSAGEWSKQQMLQAACCRSVSCALISSLTIQQNGKRSGTSLGSYAIHTNLVRLGMLCSVCRVLGLLGDQ